MNNQTDNPQIIAAKRKSLCTDLIEQLEKNFPINNLPKIEDDGKVIEFIPRHIIDNFQKTQLTILPNLLHLSMDLDNGKYIISDLRLGEKYESKK